VTGTTHTLPEGARMSIGYCDGHVERDGGLESEAGIERPQ